jgi:hypothetical protein
LVLPARLFWANSPMTVEHCNIAQQMCTLEGVSQYLKKGEKSKGKQSTADYYSIKLKPPKL